LNSGLVAPGDNGNGSLLIDGDYSQESDGVFRVLVSGSVVGDQHSQLVVKGDVMLDGSLVAILDDSFGFGPSQSFDILTVGGVLTGTFDGLPNRSFVGRMNGIDLFIHYHSGGVTLYTTPTPST
jgi:hypothetical protein